MTKRKHENYPTADVDFNADFEWLEARKNKLRGLQRSVRKMSGEVGFPLEEMSEFCDTQRVEHNKSVETFFNEISTSHKSGMTLVDSIALTARLIVH